jgi:hypothetical protein
LRNDDTSKPSEDTEGKSHAALFQQLNENLTKLVVFLSGNGPVFIPQGNGKTVSPALFDVLCDIADVCEGVCRLCELFFLHSCVFHFTPYLQYRSVTISPLQVLMRLRLPFAPRATFPAKKC